jgi:tetratricopeptide (TPR) repeat protein
MADTLSPKRKALFWAILALVVVLLPLAVAEIAVRASGIRVADDPYLQFGPVQPFFVKQAVNGRQYYQAADRKLYRERKIIFPVEKGPDTFRIFCLGASASASWPHPSQETYSKYLDDALGRAYPGHKIEVINVSAHSYPTYRVRMILQEILEFDPNLLIVYSGDNEFIEPRTYSTTERWYNPLATLANHSHLFRVLRGNPLARRWFPENTLPADYVAFQRGSMDAQVAPETRKDPEQLEWVKEHYRYSIESMVKKARSRGVPVILLTVPVNLRDWHPNVSYQALQGNELARWRDHYTKGQAALLKNDPDTAVTELKLAAALSPLHGETHFFLGRALEMQGQFAESIQELSRARDLDYYPSRTISDFNATLRNVATRYDNVALADAEAAFWAASAPRAPGFEFFLDYVHPSQRGNLLVAKTVFDTIAKRKLVGGVEAVAEFSHEAQPFRCGQEERLFVKAGGCPPEGVSYDDATDLPMQVLLVRLAMMMNQNERIAAKLADLSDAPRLETLDDWSKTFLKDAEAIYPPLVELQRRQLLGESVDSEMKVALDHLEQFRLKYFRAYEKFKEKVASQKVEE